MTPTRRDVLKFGGATVGISATSGCLRGLLNREGDEGDSEGEDGGDGDDTSDTKERPSNEDEKDQGASNASDEPESNPDDMQNETDTRDQNESNESNESNETNATDEEEEELDDLAPDREETEPDREKYKQNESGDREKLPPDAISTTEPNMKIGNYGSVDISGRVTNETDVTIGVVTIAVTYYDSSESEIGRSSDSVHDIPPGESKKWSSGVGPDQLRGEPAEAEVRYQPFTESS